MRSQDVLVVQQQQPPSWCQRLSQVLRYYFWEGQLLDEKASATSQGSSSTDDNDNAPSSSTHNSTTNKFWSSPHYRKLFAIGLPAILVHIVWWSFMASQDLFHLFVEPSDKPRYYLSITMIFGSMIAGATSEGGGAVAFPVMTLVLGVKPSVARDFSLMIQSVGMVAGSFTILVMRLKLEWNAILYVTVGGVAGIIVGLEEIAPRLPPPYAKMYFVCIWSSFAIGLYLLNRNHHRYVHDTIPNWPTHPFMLMKEDNTTTCQTIISNTWQPLILMAFGILGGIFSSVAGSGIDICSFALLTLLFRVSEKVATPTSVVLMAINTAIGFAYRQFAMGGVEDEAWGYFAVCVPIVVIGAPLGALLGSHAHRLTLAGVIYVLDAAQLITALVVIQPWTTLKTDTPLHLSMTSLAVFVTGLFFFRVLAWLGFQLLKRHESQSDAMVPIKSDISTSEDTNDVVGEPTDEKNWDEEISV